MPDDRLFSVEDADRGETLPATVERQEHALERVSGPSAMDVLAQMGRDKADAEAMAVVADLVWKQEDRDAEREMARDFTAMQRDLPDFKKTKTVTVATKSGSSFSYKFEPLDRIDPVAKPIVHRHHFTYAWTSAPVDGKMVVTCILRHENGHSREATFIAPMASGTPKMSEIQKHSSSMSYAERKSLEAVLGIVTQGDDSDGNDPPEYVTEDQAMELADLARAAEADVDRFFMWCVGDEEIPGEFDAEGKPKRKPIHTHWHEIHAGQYEPAKGMLMRKMGR